MDTSGGHTSIGVHRTTVLGIPVSYARPPGDPGYIALWLSHLSAAQGQADVMLSTLARNGALAVSFEPPRHGRRADCPPGQLVAEVMSDFRQRMWPLLGHTVLECQRVADWSVRTFGDIPLVAGGVSMGGDAALAFAGIDARVTRVAGILSTPDWRRPGMRRPDGRGEPIDQGDADHYARWFFDMLDPLSNIERYGRDVGLQLQYGGHDEHIKAAMAETFVARLDNVGHCAERDVIVHRGHDHLTGLQATELYRIAATFLLG